MLFSDRHIFISLFFAIYNQVYQRLCGVNGRIMKNLKVMQINRVQKGSNLDKCQEGSKLHSCLEKHK